MDSQGWITLISGVLFPAALIVSLLSFFDRKVWPEIVKWQVAAAAASTQRHEDFISEVRKSRAAEEATAKMLLVLNTKIDSNHVQLLTVMEKNQAVVVGHLQHLDNKIAPSGFVSGRPR
jgi:hypothetical protein